MAEKRRGHRVRVNLRAQYRSSVTSMEGWVANLSRYGMFLRSDYLDDRGARVVVVIEIPGDDGALQLEGEVVRVDERPCSSGMGIRFGRMAETVHRQLANFMIERSYQSLH